MPRLIDADKAKEVLTKLLYETALNNSGGASLMCEDIAENRLETWLGLVPTVVEVVYCKDCKMTERKYKWYCVKRQNIVNDDDFCSWGDRKEDETD